MKELKWYKFPDEEPYDEGKEYVITIVEKEGDSIASTFSLATWFYCTEGDNIKPTDNWCGHMIDKLPDSFYWLQLPDLPEIPL